MKRKSESFAPAHELVVRSCQAYALRTQGFKDNEIAKMLCCKNRRNARRLAAIGKKLKELE